MHKLTTLFNVLPDRRGQGTVKSKLIQQMDLIKKRNKLISSIEHYCRRSILISRQKFVKLILILEFYSTENYFCSAINKQMKS